MKAAVLERFGGPEELVLRDIPTPDIEADEILIKVEYAGVGQWDTFEREGGYAEMLGGETSFPYVLGSEGAGTVAALGQETKGFNIGDKVFAPAFLNPKGGFYAEFAAVDHRYVSKVPECITMQEAAVISGIGITALRGLQDTLKLKPGESLIVIGASGGVGHMAAQLARSLGVEVFTAASGEDGVALVKKLGIDTAVNGRNGDILRSARAFAPEGFDAALITAGGAAADAAVRCIRKGGRIAYPNGVYPLPGGNLRLNCMGYNGEPDPEIIQRLYGFINSGRLKAHIDKVFLLENVCEAHVELRKHYLGKLCLKIGN